MTEHVSYGFVTLDLSKVAFTFSPKCKLLYYTVQLVSLPFDCYSPEGDKVWPYVWCSETSERRSGELAIARVGNEDDHHGFVGGITFGDAGELLERRG